ncbi:unnamed protein product [Diplocarpon coronariae]
MNDAELNYPIHDKELLAIFRSFHQYKYFMTTKDLIARQARWAEFFADFNFLIMYRTGTTNTLADTLLQAPADPTSRVEYDVASYHIIDEVIQANKTSPELQKFRDEAQSHSLDYELS